MWRSFFFECKEWWVGNVVWKFSALYNNGREEYWVMMGPEEGEEEEEE